MSYRNVPALHQASPTPFIKPTRVLSLSALSINCTDIGGSSKRKVNGELAGTRLGGSVTQSWANERLRQTMLLVLELRMSWPNQSLLTSDDVEYLRTAIDVALASAKYNGHTASIYDLNPTTWAIFLTQHVKSMRKGSWTVETEAAQKMLSFEYLYDWLGEQHKRDDRFNVKDSATGQLLHRYKLPYKPNMIIPPERKEMFKYRKGAKQLSDWMFEGGLAPIDAEIQKMEPAKVVERPLLESNRETARSAMWGRVAARARVRQLTSVTERDGEDERLTLGVVTSVMDASRGDSDEMSDEDAAALVRELENALEEQQSEPAPSGLSDYELQRLANIAKNRQVLQDLGLAESQSPPTRAAATLAREKFPPGRSGAAPSRRSTRERETRSYAEKSDEDEESEAALKWTLAEIEEAANADD